MHYTTKVAIIGSGSAAYTAGIYFARANLEPVIFVGVARAAARVSPRSKTPASPAVGPELMERMQKQCERLGVKIIRERSPRSTCPRGPSASKPPRTAAEAPP